MEKRKKRFQGIVVSNKPNKSIVVEVTTKRKHPRYGKQVVWSKKYMVQDSDNYGQVGDIVEIVESRLHSKRKAFKLNKIVSKTEKIQ